jgi:phage-related minor tail protein
MKTDKKWEQERKRREREQYDLDQEELRELELANSELDRKQAQLQQTTGKKRGVTMQPDQVTQDLEHLKLERAELQLARNWEQKEMHLDLKDEDELLCLKSWH